MENAKEEDLILLFQLNKELIDKYEDISSIDYTRVLAWVKKNLAASLPHFRRVLADGEIAGYFCLTPQEETYELDSLFVLPQFQNRGIGSWILDSCIQQTSGNLYFYVFHENKRAITLYQRHGFVISKEVGKTRYIMQFNKEKAV